MAESAENSCDQLKHTGTCRAMYSIHDHVERDQGVDYQIDATGSRPPSAASKGVTMHWFAYVGPDPPEYEEERESRLKSFKEKQNEERHRKLEEIKAHAMAAQRFKEQKEQERRKRIEELRMREESHRQQVEERKKMIEEAERERLESIIRRNQEREARIEAKKKNERSSMVFAFGSSTPRMLEPLDNAASFWGHRRATSTHNITYNAGPLTRRQSERELDGGSKKRATSAGGLERSEDMRMSTSMYEVFHWEATSESSMPMPHIPPAHPNMFNTSSLATTPQHPAGCISGYVGRRRTDLMPTIPSKDSPTTPPRKPFARSPGPSRPGSSLSQQSASSVASSSVSVRHRTSVTPKRQRPVSIAVTGITIDQIKNGPVDLKKENKPPIPKARKSSLQKSQEKINRKKTAEASPKSALSPASTPKVLQSPVENKNITKEIENVQNEKKENVTEVQQPLGGDIPKNPSPPVNSSVENVDVELPKVSQEPPKVENHPTDLEDPGRTEKVPVPPVQEKLTENTQELQPVQSSELAEGIDMSASFSSKRLITTEEEAKAALAERRRLAREEAERQAEMERKRLEEEALLEFERQQREEEQQRQLIELQRATEEARLKEAIKEAQKREEEEKQKKEEEQRLRMIKEETEKKAREEAERQKAELQERLKNEEKEREARRKRVEAIMLRTRGKTNSTASSQVSEEKNEENKSEKMNGSKIESYENKTGEEKIISNVESNKLEESKIILAENKISVTENGHKNEKDIETVNNLIQLDSLKNANTVISNTINTDDSINSNDGWQENNTKADLLM